MMKTKVHCCSVFNSFLCFSNMPNKVRILQSVNHPCIITLEHVIDTYNFLFIVLELAEGRKMFDKSINKTKLNKAKT